MMKLLASNKSQLKRSQTGGGGVVKSLALSIMSRISVSGVFAVSLNYCLLVMIIITITAADCKPLSEKDLLLSDLLVGRQQNLNNNNNNHQHDNKPQDLIRLMSDNHWIPVNQRQQQQKHHSLLQDSSHDQRQVVAAARIAANLVAQQSLFNDMNMASSNSNSNNNNNRNNNNHNNSNNNVSSSNSRTQTAVELNVASSSSAKPVNSFTLAPPVKSNRPCDHNKSKQTAEVDQQTAASNAPGNILSNLQQEILKNSAVPSGTSNSSSHERSDGGGEDQQDYDNSDEHDADESDSGDETIDLQSTDLLAGNESVSHESALPPPLPLPPVDSDSSDGAESRQRRRSYSSSSNNNSNDADDDNDNDNSRLYDDESSDESAANSPETPPDEAAARREQEAAEASEAEAANRSALAEQQQQQREIILAQAESEARAIKEQQEALLKQQQMQQQILMRRNQNFLNDQGIEKDRRQQQSRGSNAKAAASVRSSEKRHNNFSNNNNNKLKQQKKSSRRPAPRGGDMDHQLLESAQHQFAPIDNQFSDQLENRSVDRGTASASVQNLHTQQQQHQDRALQRDRKKWQRDDNNDSNLEQSMDDDLSGDYSVRQPQHSSMTVLSNPASVLAATNSHTDKIQEPIIGAKFNLTSNDLLTAAQQHHYGAYYGSLNGHHHNKGGSGGGGGGYYQFAESHKKGQFDSGYRRGSKKFVISGHSSQNKGHAEGHVKWHGKKGKGTHYWDYKHKNKKHYGGGDSYGGGHHHY